MSNLLPNITGITVIGGCSSGIYRDIYYENEPEYEEAKEKLKWLLMHIQEDKRVSFVKEECHIIIDFNTTPTLVHIHKSYQSYTKGFLTPYPYLVIKKEKKKMYFDYHDTRKVFPFTHRVKTIKRYKVNTNALTWGEIKAHDTYKDLENIVKELKDMVHRIDQEKKEKEEIKVDHFEYISDERLRSYKDIEFWCTYVEYEKVMNKVLLEIYDYIKKNYCRPMRESYMIPLKNPTVFLEKGCDDIITIRGKDEKYRDDYSINLRLYKNYIHVDFNFNNSSLIPSMQCENLFMVPTLESSNYRYLFDEMENMKSIFILPEDKKVEIKSLVYFNERGNCAIFNKDTEVCKDMTIVIMKQYEDILESIKLVSKDNKDALYILKDPVEVYIDEKEHAIKIRNKRYCSLFGVAEYITIDYSYDRLKSEYIKKVDFEIVDRKPIPDLIIKPKKARDIYLGETLERSIDKSKEALKSMYLEKVKWNRRNLKTKVNSLTVREEKTDNTIKEKFYKASEVLEDENINSYFNNLKYIFEPLLKEPIDINKVDYILENANISLLKKMNGEYIITLTQEVTDCIVGLIQDSIEIVKRGDFLRYYFVKTDTLVYTHGKEELFELHLNERDKKYPAAVSIWNRLDLTLHGLLGYHYIQKEESETTNKIDIKCIKYEDEDEVIHKFEDKEWKDNKSYKFIKEKILSVLQDFRNIKINNENLKDLLKDALVEIKSASYYSFRIYPSKNPKSKYKSWIIARIEDGGISFKYTTVNILDYSDIEKDCHLYYLPIEKYNSDLYYLIPDLIKVFENIRYNDRITIRNIRNIMNDTRTKVSVNNRLSSYIARLVNEIVYINNEPFVHPGEYDVAISESCGLKFLYIRKSDDLNTKYDILLSEKYIELSGNGRSTITENEAGIQGEYYRNIKKICDSIIEEIDRYSYIEEDEELEEITEENGMKVIITEDTLIKALERADEYTKDYKGDFSLDKLEQKEINSKYQIILYYSEGE